MSKPKRNNNRKPSHPAPLPTINATDLDISELEGYLNAVDRHYYADKWDQKHRLIQVDVDGKIISEYAIPLKVAVEQVIPVLPIRKHCFALLLITEAWANTNPLPAEFCPPELTELRNVVWVDILGRTKTGLKIRGQEAFTVNEDMFAHGLVVVMLHRALGQYPEVPRMRRVEIALSMLMGLSKDFILDTGAREGFPFAEFLKSPNFEEQLIQMFDNFAEYHNSVQGLGLTSQAAKHNAFALAVPLISAMELELSLRALLPEGYELPEMFCAPDSLLV